MKKFLVLALILGLVAGVALLGTAQTAQKVYNIGLLDDITTTNMIAGIGPDSTVYNFAVYNWNSSLYTLTDKTFEFVPALADGMPSNLPPKLSDKKQPNGKPLYETTVHLKKGIYWSDGNEFTADDVVFTYNLIKKYADQFGGNWSGQLYPKLFYSIQKIDNFTVKFYLTSDSINFKWGTLMLTILPKAQWAPIVAKAEQGSTPAKDILAAQVAKPVSIGPFIFNQWQKGAFAVNDKNPTYYDEGSHEVLYKNGAVHLYNDGTANPKAIKYDETYYGTATGPTILNMTTGPFVDKVIYHVYTDQATAVLALSKGTIDFIENPNGLQQGFVDQLKSAKGVTLVQNPPNGWRYLAFNLRKSPGKYLAYRQAVAYLINKEFVCNDILGGRAVPQYSVVPPANTYWYNPNVPAIGKGMDRAARIEKAVSLLKAAGFTWKQEPVVQNGKLVTPGKGLIDPTGTPVPTQTLLCPSTAYDPMRASFGIWIDRWLNEVGIPVKLNLTGFNTIVGSVFGTGTPTYDMYILGWGLGNPAFPDFMYAFFASSQDYPAGFNTPGFKNEQFDQAMHNMMASWDPTVERKYAFQAQEILAEQLPYVVLFYSPMTEAYRSDHVVFPYVHVLDGLQGVYGEQSVVKIIQ